MNESTRALAERKHLLLARSRLHRLEIQYQLAELRQSFARPRAALSFVASPAVRPLIFGALTALLGGGRLARLLKGALAVLAVAKAVSALHGLADGVEGDER